jgi:hypothetical protein
MRELSTLGLTAFDLTPAGLVPMDDVNQYRTGILLRNAEAWR